MQKKLTKWNLANYEIQLIVTPTENQKAKDKVLKEFQKDMDVQWFRKWHVPMNMVEQNVKPEYLQIGIYEEVINIWIQELLQENKDIKFIWEPYDFNQKQEGEDTVITMKLDIYPQVEILDPKWNEKKMDEIKVEVTPQEIDNAINSIKKNYAEYKDADTITIDSVSKVFVEYLDKDWNVLDKSHIYLWEQEFAEDKFLKDTFLNKKKEEIIQIKYDEKTTPTLLINKKENLTISDIKFTLKDIKQIVLPEINEETLTKLFGKESEVKTLEQLNTYITNEITKQKEDNMLMQTIDWFLQKIQPKYMKISIPQTLINEEYNVRLKSFEERFGWKERVEQYYTQIGEEKKNEMLEEIKKSSKISLEKFFILQEITKELWIDIDRQKSQNLEVEKQIYAKLSWKKQSSPKAESPKKDKEEKAKKAPGKPKAKKE